MPLEEAMRKEVAMQNLENKMMIIAEKWLSLHRN
jgi:hypothetical protein